MSKWRLAKSLITLREQLNKAFPDRSKVSDGSVGDLRHSKTTSDHNPNSANVVTAIDVTNDTDAGDLGGQMLVDALYRSRDPRIKYLIFNKQITIQPFGSGWKAYKGVNPHQHHVHISVSSDPKLYDDAKEWTLNFKLSDNIPPAAQLVKKGMKGAEVLAIQKRLVELNLLKPSDADSDFGAKTENALKAFQLSVKLTADGIVGLATRKALFRISN